jgi:hypothetical protein
MVYCWKANVLCVLPKWLLSKLASSRDDERFFLAKHVLVIIQLHDAFVNSVK